jgi:hypothetical protein
LRVVDRHSSPINIILKTASCVSLQVRVLCRTKFYVSYPMSDLQRALADIGHIRSNLAAGTLFRGFGPSVMAATGVLALATAILQSLFVVRNDPDMFIVVWTAVAIVSAALIGTEMVARTRRHHGGLADAMLFNAVEHFLPVGAAGAMICLILLTFAPDAVWLLPGLWQVLLGVGLFVALRFLPRSIAFVAAWYFVAGAAVLIVACETRQLSPWMMGVPFGIGQILMAALLHMATEGDDEQV